MTPAIANVIVMAVTIGGALGQSPAQRPAFEVASVRMYAPESPTPEGGRNGFKSSPQGVTARYTKLWACLEWAYDIPGRVLGPAWIYSERYDIVAQAATRVPEAQLKLMVQTLLEDRFKLKLHRETRELPVTVLVVGKNGPRNLRAVETGDSPGIERMDGKLVLKNVSMSSFAEALTNVRPPYGVGEKVIDKTGLKGRFDISLSVQEFDPDVRAFAGDYEEMRAAFFAFFSRAIEKQYGLRLERRKLPLETLVVEDGTKVPTEN